MCLNRWKCKLSTLAPICLAAPQRGLWVLHVRYPLAIPGEVDFARRYTPQKWSNLLPFKVIPNQFSPPLLPYYKGQGKLVEVDGMGSIDVVARAIDGALAGVTA